MDIAEPQVPVRPRPILIATILCVAWGVASVSNYVFYLWTENVEGELIWIIFLVLPLVIAPYIWLGFNRFRFLSALLVGAPFGLPIIMLAVADIGILEVASWGMAMALFSDYWPTMVFGIPALVLCFLPVSNEFFAKSTERWRKDSAVQKQAS
ncbi:MAG: hypothetical protein SGI88_03045 [Candidatus Hydrogenedentes bacterium]|nr:hypothetical protein [Candidatus Hydrogenedentota bacterium]